MLLIAVVLNACNDREIIDRKDGDSLPAVSNLALQQDGPMARLTWAIPAAIPESIEQPVRVYIEVKEILNPTRAISVFNITLSNSPTEFVYEIPDVNKTYHLTVKLNGTTKNRDVNYSSNIYSLGQTVIFN